MLRVFKVGGTVNKFVKAVKTWRQNLRDVPQDYKVSDYEKLLERDTTTKKLKHSIWKKPKE